MFRALEIAASGMASEQVAMNAVANNLSNTNTTGFKATEVQFEEMLNTEGVGGSTAPEGVQVAATETNQTQGTLNQTGNTWDLGINGQGYFPLTGANGQQLYTRVGSFTLNAQGQIVNQNGLLLAGGISIPTGEQNINIAADGTITGTPPGSAQPVVLGQIQLTTFANPQGLTDQGQGVLAATANSGPAMQQNGSATSLGIGGIQQGFLEGSNVNMVQEMVNMINTQRAYESGAKVISAADQMLSYANNLVK